VKSERFAGLFRAHSHLLTRAAERGFALALAASLFLGVASCDSSTERTDGTDSDDGDTSSSGSGGGPTFEGLCDRICDCEGCSDTEHAECIDQLEDDQQQSEVEGCATEFDDFIECSDAELECVGDDVDLAGCSTLQEALASCYGG